MVACHGLVVVAYPHPTQAAIILSSALAGGARFVPAAYGDEVAAAADRREQLYMLSPAGGGVHSAHSSGGAADVDQLSELLSSGARLDGSLREIDGLAVLGSAVRGLVAAMDEAEAFTPAFDEVKLRFYLGRQFFYAPKGVYGSLSSKGNMSLSTMQGLTIGEKGDIKAVYSNAVPSSSVPRLRAKLEQMGFKREGTKSTATLHLIKQRGYSSAAVGAALAVRKVKSGQQKLFFLTRTHGDSAPDMRLKLGDAAHGTDTWAVANACQLSGGHIHLPATHRAAFAVDKVRFKSEEVFEGTLQAGGTSHALRFSLNSVSDDQGRHHWEATGSCLDLAAARGSAREEAVQAVLGFCQALRAAL
ncbi:hypothetical protein ABPG75_003299 [Micractinium tetrahymenae]